MRKTYLRLLFKVLRKRGILSDTVFETEILLVLSNEHLPNLESNLKNQTQLPKIVYGPVVNRNTLAKKISRQYSLLRNMFYGIYSLGSYETIMPRNAF